MNELWSILVARWRRHGLDSEPATSAHDPSTPHGLPYESAGRGGGYTGTGKATPGRGCRPCGGAVFKVGSDSREVGCV